MRGATSRLPLVPGAPGATPETLRRDWYRLQAEKHGRYLHVLLTNRDVFDLEARGRGGDWVLIDLLVTWARTAATFAHLSGVIEAPR